MRIFSVFIILLSISCHSSKNTTKQLCIEDANSIALERTACYGTCPVYHVTIFKDGTVKYEGKHHVDLLGSYVGSIDKLVALALFAKINTFSWDAYPDKFPIDNYDFPQFHIAYTVKAQTKLVKANTNAAKELIALSKEIDNLVGGVKFKKE